MARAEVSLGSIALISSTSDLQLHLESRAQLASSADNADGICERLTCTVLTSYNSKDFWISRGNDFRLTIRLQFAVEGLNRILCTQSFAHNLYHAEELWKPLHLLPSSIQVSRDDMADTSLITLHLSHESVSLGSCLHKLAEGVPFHDVRPPVGITELEMDSVQLSIRVKLQDETKRRKCDIRTSGQGNTSSEASLPEPGNLTPWSIIEQTFQPVLVAGDDEMLFDDHDQAECTVHGPFRPDESALEHMTSTNMPLHDDRFVSEQTALQLLDAGLRYSIAASPKRNLKGISVSGRESFQPLAEIAPALWSPGYHLAVSRRAILIPTIGHALTRTGTASAHRESLRTKMAELSRRYGGPIEAGSEEVRDSRTSHAVQTSIAQRLWQLAQHSLLDPDAAGRLKSTLASGCTAMEPEDEGYDGDVILDSGSDVMDPDTMLDDYSEDEISLLDSDCPDSMVRHAFWHSSHGTLSPNTPEKPLMDSDDARLPSINLTIDDDMLSVCDSMASVTLLAAELSRNDVESLELDWWSDLDACDDDGKEGEMLFVE